MIMKTRADVENVWIHLCGSGKQQLAFGSRYLWMGVAPCVYIRENAQTGTPFIPP